MFAEIFSTHFWRSFGLWNSRDCPGIVGKPMRCSRHVYGVMGFGLFFILRKHAPFEALFCPLSTTQARPLTAILSHNFPNQLSNDLQFFAIFSSFSPSIFANLTWQNVKACSIAISQVRFTVCLLFSVITRRSWERRKLNRKFQFNLQWALERFLLDFVVLSKNWDSFF